MARSAHVVGNSVLRKWGVAQLSIQLSEDGAELHRVVLPPIITSDFGDPNEHSRGNSFNVVDTERAGWSDDGIEPDAVLAERLDVFGKIKTSCLSSIIRDIRNEDAARLGVQERSFDLGDNRRREHAGEQRTRPDDDKICIDDRLHCRSRRVRVSLFESEIPNAGRPFNGDLSNERAVVGVSDQGDRVDGGRMDGADGTNEPSDLGDRSSKVAACTGQPSDQKIADGVPFELALIEAMLERSSQQAVVTRQRRQTTPKITWSRQPEFFSKPP